MPAASASLDFSIDTTVQDCVSTDVITFELISEYQPYSRNWTGSLTQGSLTIDLQTILVGGYPYATGSGGWIVSTSAPNIISINSSLASFYGGNFQQVPFWTSGSTDISSSLNNQYGEINYPFLMTFGDRIIIKSFDGRTQLLTFKSISVGPSQTLKIEVLPDLNQYFISHADLIDTILIVKRVPDEQNIILQFNKPPGDTSYGFIISNDIDLKLLNNISALQANVQNQLLSTQQNSQ